VVDESDVPALPASVDGVAVHVAAGGRITPHLRPGRATSS
jgi:hypothetical protein